MKLMVALGDVIAHHVRPPNASSSCSSAVASSAGSGDEVRVEFFSLSCLFLRLHVLISMGGERQTVSATPPPPPPPAHCSPDIPTRLPAASARPKILALSFMCSGGPEPQIKARVWILSVGLSRCGNTLSSSAGKASSDHLAMGRFKQKKKSHWFLNTLGIGM